MRKKALKWSLLAAVGLTLGLLLAPGDREIALMQLEDEKLDEALSHYRTLYEAGDRSNNVIIPLLKLHIKQGDIDSAIALTEHYVAEHPASAEGVRQLASLNKSSQHLYSYCRSLEALYALASSAGLLRELADTYDFLGEYAQEAGALVRLTERRDYAPRERDYMRLASFQYLNGQTQKAAETAMRMMARMHRKVSIEAMQTAMTLLLDHGQAKEAREYALDYLGAGRKPKDAAMLSALFLQRGELQMADDALAPFLAQDNDPDMLQQWMLLRIAQGREQEVSDVLEARLAQGTLPPGLHEMLIDLAMKRRDYEAAVRILSAAPADMLPEETLLSYAEHAFHAARPDLASALREHLPADASRDMPLLVALLDLTMGQGQGVRALLALPREETASPSRALLVAGVLLRHGHTAQARALLKDIPVAGMLGALSGLQIAELYIGRGEVEEGLAFLQRAAEGKGPQGRAAAEVYLLLAAADGRADMVRQWLEAHPDVAVGTLDDAQVAAARHRYFALSTALAVALYQREKTPPRHLQLAYALVQEGRYGEAFPHLEALVGRSREARQLYFSALAGWIRRQGMHAAGFDKTLHARLMQALALPDVTVEEKRSIAYLLAETGLREKAAEIFLALAEGQPFGSYDVNELLALWGERLSPQAAEWVETRARASEGAEKAAWLAHLNATGLPERVVAVVDDRNASWPRAVFDQYAEALGTMKATKRLGALLAREMEEESDTRRLEKLAALAERHGLEKAAEQGWKAVHEREPENLEAIRQLGLHAFSARRYTEAEQLLEQYLKERKGDYRTHYAYAELMQRQRRNGEAERFYQHAHAEVAGLQQKDVSTLAAEAHLLYRTGRIEESLEKYRALLARYPENKELRADFAEVLIQTRQYEEASLVLAP